MKVRKELFKSKTLANGEHPIAIRTVSYTHLDILTEIIACKQIEIELQKAAISKEMLINNCNEPIDVYKRQHIKSKDIKYSPLVFSYQSD